MFLFLFVNKYVPALLAWQITQMFSKFAAKVLLQTAKCRQLIKKNAEKVIFYAKKFDQLKKKQYICSGFVQKLFRVQKLLNQVTIIYKKCA